MAWRRVITLSRLSRSHTSPPSLGCAGQSYLQCRYYAKKKKSTPKLQLDDEEADIVDMMALKDNMTKVMDSLKWEYANVVTTKLNPSVIGDLQLSNVKMRDVCKITMPNPQNILINFMSQPSYLQEAVSAIRAKVNLNPSIDGQIIKASIPKPSKEARDNLCKEAKKSADNAKTRVRRVRQMAITGLRKQKDEISKDTMNKLENVIQTVSDEHMDIIDEMLKSKNTDIQRQ